jgi:glycosyltransferase involved in cell wall biosynthesis
LARPKIHVVNEYGDDFRPHSTTFIRWIRPLNHPKIKPYLDVSIDLRYQGQTVDMVIVDRLWRPDVSLELMKGLVSSIKSAGAKFIYTLDDNFFDLVQENKGWPPVRFMGIVDYLLLHADGVIVTTPALKERLENFNANIKVIQNALDEGLLVPRIPAKPARLDTDRPITIGYMGSLTHDEDLMMVLPALKEIYGKYSNRIEFQIVGVIRNEMTRDQLKEIPIRFISPKPYENEYPLFMLWFTGRVNWDITISPLRDTLFNRSKSDIKFLDSSAIGAASICSRILPYKSTVKHKETGWLAENQTQDWIEAMDSLIVDHNLRLRVARNAIKYLYNERTLARTADKWVEVLTGFLE